LQNVDDVLLAFNHLGFHRPCPMTLCPLVADARSAPAPTNEGYRAYSHALSGTHRLLQSLHGRQRGEVTRRECFIPSAEAHDGLGGPVFYALRLNTLVVRRAVRVGQRQKKAHVDLSQKPPQNCRRRSCVSETSETDLLHARNRCPDHRLSTRIRPRLHRPPVPRPAARRPHRSGREPEAGLQRQAVWNLYTRAAAWSCRAPGLRASRRRYRRRGNRQAWA
jgi:hypothetical protein